MRRIIPLSLVMLAVASGLAFADPDINVTYLDGTMRVRLEGSYAGSYYMVYRSGEPASGFGPLFSDNTLCTGDCFVHDLEAVPGHTYYYRFDLIQPAGEFVSYGPYAVTVPNTPFAARLWPNPGRGATHVELSLPGGRRDAPLDVDARIVDLQGRKVRTLFHGPLGRGANTITWDGRGDNGQALRAGLYFLRYSSTLGVSTSRIIRFQ